MVRYVLATRHLLGSFVGSLAGVISRGPLG